MRTVPAQYPDMRVRIYHDAHLVEAQQWAGVHTQPLPDGATHPRGA